MANQKRQPAKAQPISAHPLFPAVVALWFGALFGLGSLAVRPSLLENLVLQSHIDLILPAAAPPLGITARILLALVMAALGALLGIWLSRRLIQPSIEIPERKRGAKELAAQRLRVRARDAHPDAPARRPISAHEELGSESAVANEQIAPSGPGMLANRRRALTMIEDEPQFVPHDFAPLPGGLVIQSVALAAMALPETAPPLPATPEPQISREPATQLDWSQAAQAADGQLPAAAPVLLDLLPTSTSQPLAVEAAHRDGRQVFGMAPPEPQAQAPRQIFGIVAENDHLPQSFIQAAGFQTSVFDTPGASPLFDRGTPEPAAPPIVSAAEQLTSPASLGLADLAARLAESMRRRRERAVTPAADQVANPAEQRPDQAPANEVSGAALPAMSAGLAPPSADEPACAQMLPQVTVAAPVPVQLDTPAPLAMPAAMRPLALDAFLADDDAFDPGLLPPRHIAMPAAIAAPPVFAVPIAPLMAQSAADQPADAPAEDEPAEDERLTAESADNPYASLLGLAPPRPAFVRIEEPATDIYDAPEPVVIFPGQAPQMVPILATAPLATEDNAFRRFDAPSSAGQGQPVAATSAAATVDPVEAERALRAALNNLQRMSGAA